MFVELHRKDNGIQVTINSDYVVYFFPYYVKEQKKGVVQYTKICYDPLTLTTYEEEPKEKFVPDGSEIYIDGCTTTLVVEESYEKLTYLLKEAKHNE